MTVIMTLTMLRGCALSSVRFAAAHSATHCACANAMKVSTSAALERKKKLMRKETLDLVQTITKKKLDKKKVKSKSQKQSSLIS